MRRAKVKEKASACERGSLFRVMGECREGFVHEIYPLWEYSTYVAVMSNSKDIPRKIVN